MCLKGKNLFRNLKQTRKFNGNNQFSWEFLKCEIQKFNINYSKKIAKNPKNKTERLQRDSNSQPLSL